MRFAPSSVPKRDPEAGGSTTDGCGLHFCTIAEAASEFSRRTAGRLLLVADAGSYPQLAPLSLQPRAMLVVLTGADVLPLFTMPDGVGAVFAAGGEETLVAARFFAGVRGIPCALAPADGALRGVFEGEGDVISDGARMRMPLKEGEVYCDAAFMRPTLGDALACISLSRLARFEARALAVFGSEKNLLCEAEPGEISPESIVRANAALRRSEREGAWRGEGTCLLLMYRTPDARRAVRELTALYSAFFRCGKPRKYAVANYGERAKRAGCAYGELQIPSPEQYARNALMLERRRADFLRELELITQKNSAEIDSVYAFSKPVAIYNGMSEELLRLPEHCPNGLCALIRDFGLLERP